MNPNDFVFKQIYEGAMNEGANQDVAHRAAVNGLELYKKSHMQGAKVSKFIKDQIIAAKKASKGVK